MAWTQAVARSPRLDAGDIFMGPATVGLSRAPRQPRTARSRVRRLPRGAIRAIESLCCSTLGRLCAHQKHLAPHQLRIIIMPRYTYAPWDADCGEIRLVELHPGAFDDPITISLQTKSLIVPPPRPLQKQSLEQIRASLPEGWEASETLDGRIVFGNRMQQRTTWTHPDPRYCGAAYKADEQALEMVEPAYEALSYTWGSDETQTDIEVLPLAQRFISNLEPDKVTLPIRSNLHTALKHLRNQTTTRVLWIDAISINQSDVAERSEHVKHMGDIFKFARRVIVWLGVASDNSSLAMRVLGHMADQVEITKTSNVWPRPHCTEPEWYDAIDASCVDDDPTTWHAVYDLVTRPWFSRLWVSLSVCGLHARRVLTGTWN